MNKSVISSTADLFREHRRKSPTISSKKIVTRNLQEMSKQTRLGKKALERKWCLLMILLVSLALGMEYTNAVFALFLLCFNFNEGIYMLNKNIAITVSRYYPSKSQNIF